MEGIDILILTRHPSHTHLVDPMGSGDTELQSQPLLAQEKFGSEKNGSIQEAALWIRSGLCFQE